MSGEQEIREAELHAFIDGELTKEERAEIEALLAAAPNEAAIVRELDEINGEIRARYAYRLTAPLPAAMSDALARVREPRSGILRRLVPLAAALLLAVVAAAAGYMARDLATEPAKPELAFVTTALGAHKVYVPEVRHPVEVAASEEKHLVQWLTKRIGAAVRAPALSAEGWKLVGGRLLPDAGLPAAQFMYEDATGRRLTLYLRRETGLANTSFLFAESGDLGAFYWIDRPLAYALTGRIGREELMGLARTVYTQLETLDRTDPGGAPVPKIPR